MSEPTRDDVDLELVRHTAALARLEIAEVDVPRIASEFARILEAFRALQSVDVAGVEPLARATETADVVRADRARPSLPRERALANAPEHTDEFFRVPKTVGGEP
jgi:aspartyl-tRNA(Asn)/glutamyl-tRNA(Gln) amidotransferase subunit C